MPASSATKSAPIGVRHRRGLHVREAGLWLDPPARRQWALVSHAHSDHYARPDVTVCSPPTEALINAKYRYGVDEAIPLSDHAGHDELLQLVEQVRPRVVYTVHGYTTEFAADLRRRGIEAWSLVDNDQLELHLDRA
jgi:Cft2 family RNA processing exonuclease